MKVSGKILDLEARKVYEGELRVEGGMIQEIRPARVKSDNYIMPGLVDAHVHIESSMTTPSRFAEAIVPHGTLGVVSDPHEIANVLGVEGVEYMIKDVLGSPVCFNFGAPSCVPATDYETSGATVSWKDVEYLLEQEEIGYLSEMMNFPGVINGDRNILRKIEAAQRRNKPVDGHAPELKGPALEKYIKAGISTDHECSTIEEALEKIGFGMKILIREGSAARNLNALKDLIKTHPGMLMLCSDDLHPEMLGKGHINVLVRRLLKDGYDLFDVLRTCTVNPVNHYGLKLGLLRVGDPADFIITGEPSEMNVRECYRRGRRIYSGGKTDFVAADAEPVNKFNCSPISVKDIEVKRQGERMRIIVARDGELLTQSAWINTGEKDNVTQNTGEDILKLVVKDRYNDSPPAVCFIKGFGLKRGAFASSVAHDSHNLVCLGATDEEIVDALNELVSLRGGLAVTEGKRTESLQLNIAGILSGKPVAETAAAYEKLSKLVNGLGSQLSAPFMTLSFMSLLVIPELKLSDKGLFDGTSFKFVSMFS